MAVTAAQVKELRDATGLGMMDCKKALVEADGSLDDAIKLLREKGAAVADKKAGRDTKEGLIAAAISTDGTSGALVRVNCETDFVAKNDTFKAYVNELATEALALEDGALADAARDGLNSKIQEIGENLVIAGNVRYNGAVAAYIHMGGKVGILLEAETGKAGTAASDAFQNFGKDVCMQIAAMPCECISRDDLDSEKLEAEKDVFRKQMEGKPAEVIEKIVEGKMGKYYSQVVLLEQAFIKDGDTTIGALLEKTAKELDDTITLKRFTRWQIGA